MLKTNAVNISLAADAQPLTPKDGLDAPVAPSNQIAQESYLAERTATFDHYERILTESIKNHGGDAKIIKLVRKIIAWDRACLGLEDSKDATMDPKEQRRIRKLISQNVKKNWEWRAELATIPCKSSAGLKAKAIIIREYNNCSGRSGYDDDAMAWSIAADLLGLPSMFDDDQQLAA